MMDELIKDEKAVKILFRFYSTLLDMEMEETIWAIVEDQSLGYFRIDSIPYYVTALATDDIVHAEYDDEEEMLTYRNMVKESGNSTIWVVIVNDEIDIEDVQQIFFDMNCESASLSERFFTMEVKAEINYLKVKDKLNALKADRSLDYVEACLSENHRY